jgi:hypothetical protein
VNNQTATFPEQHGFSGQLAFEPYRFPAPHCFSEQLRFPEAQAFTTEDVLWAVGIWSVILCLSPVIVFYMLMVA